MRFGDREYRGTVGSDVDRNGMYLEVDELTGSHPTSVLEVFYSDSNGAMTITAHRAELPFELVEWALGEARRRLPPAPGTA